MLGLALITAYLASIEPCMSFTYISMAPYFVKGRIKEQNRTIKNASKSHEKVDIKLYLWPFWRACLWSIGMTLQNWDNYIISNRIRFLLVALIQWKNEPHGAQERATMLSNVFIFVPLFLSNRSKHRSRSHIDWQFVANFKP